MIDSDGTVAIYFGYPTGGTEQTVGFCITERKPYVLIDAEEVGVEQAAKKVGRFIGEHSVVTLNVAGPRASGEPRAYEYAKKVILSVLQRHL